MAQRILAYAVSRVAEDRPAEWVDPPSLPAEPFSPNRYLIALIGLLGGGVLYVGLPRRVAGKFLSSPAVQS